MIQTARYDTKIPIELCFKLHLLGVILSNLGWYLINGIISIEGAKSLEENRKNTINSLHKMALFIVNSFGIPEHLLTAPIA
jgi:hypothetical protein